MRPTGRNILLAIWCPIAIDGPRGDLQEEQAAAEIVAVPISRSNHQEAIMGLGRGALLWLLGIPLPIIILLALFWR
jgi:hypothetical protein